MQEATIESQGTCSSKKLCTYCKYGFRMDTKPPSLVQKFAMEPQTEKFVQVLNISDNH